MPTYDYQCTTCGVSFELLQSFSEDTLTKCPTKKSGNSPAGCVSPGRGKVTKIFSAPGITFKGSGFYKTDSRGSSSKSAGDKVEKKSSDASTSSDKSSSTDSSSSSSSSSSKDKASTSTTSSSSSSD